MTHGGSTPSVRNASIAACTCPLAPSIKRMPGKCSFSCARRLHFFFHLANEPMPPALEHHAQRADLLAILFACYTEIAGGSTLANRMEQTGPKPAPTIVVALDVETTGAKLEDALEHLDRS